MSTTRRTLQRLTAVSLVGTLAAASFLVGSKWWNEVEKNTYTAYFTESNGLFAGDEVRILGVAVGLIGAALLPHFADTRVIVSVPAAVGAIVIAMAVGVGFGVYPASRASRLAPIDALRSE